MKMGFRAPSIKKSFSARTSGRITRSVRRATTPFYGKRGAGWIKNPKRAAYNAVYKRTTFGVSDIAHSKKTQQSANIVAHKAKRPFSSKTYGRFSSIFRFLGKIYIVMGILFCFFSLKGALFFFLSSVFIFALAKHYRNITDE